MKISFVELQGFRGFKDAVRFDIPSGFAVITGRNGVGKSTVLDAVEFALTGTIDKFHGVKRARGGGLDEHIWWVGPGAASEHYVKIGFVCDGGYSFAVRRSRENGLETPLADFAARFCVNASELENWPDTLIQTSLIRDETITSLSMDLAEQARANAVRSTIGVVTRKETAARTKAIVDVAKGERASAAARVEGLRLALSQSLTQLTEARSVADRSANVSSARKTISDLEGSGSNEVPNFNDFIVQRIAARRRAISLVQDAIARAQDFENERLYFVSEGTELLAQTERLIREKSGIVEEKSRTLEVAQNALNLARSGDELISHLVEICRHGEAAGLQEGHCPLCDAERSEREFRTAIESLKSRLDERYQSVKDLADKQLLAERAFDEARSELESLTTTRDDLSRRRDALNDLIGIVEHVFEVQLGGGTVSDLGSVRQAWLKKESELADLEQATLILQSSSLQERVVSLESRIRATRAQLQDEEAKLVAATRAVELADQVDTSGKTIVNEMLNEQFDIVLPLLKELYRRLRPHADWREIETDFGGKVRASLNFTVGDGHNPQFMFSSGQRRAAGIGFLLAIHLSRPWCNLRSLLMDDPVQHIDDYRALNLAEVLSAVRRTGRQVIIAVEDQALAEALGRRMRATSNEGGTMFSLKTADTGSGTIESARHIWPTPEKIVRIAG